MACLSQSLSRYRMLRITAFFLVTTIFFIPSDAYAQNRSQSSFKPNGIADETQSPAMVLSQRTAHNLKSLLESRLGKGAFFSIAADEIYNIIENGAEGSTIYLDFADEACSVAARGGGGKNFTSDESAKAQGFSCVQTKIYLGAYALKVILRNQRQSLAEMGFYKDAYDDAAPSAWTSVAAQLNSSAHLLAAEEISEKLGIDKIDLEAAEIDRWIGGDVPATLEFSEGNFVGLAVRRIENFDTVEFYPMSMSAENQVNWSTNNNAKTNAITKMLELDGYSAVPDLVYPQSTLLVEWSEGKPVAFEQFFDEQETLNQFFLLTGFGSDRLPDDLADFIVE